MNKSTIVAAVLLSTVGTAYASSTGDWTGVIKVQASYTDPTYDPDRLGLEITVDVVYDKPGRGGKAWGTMTFMGVADPAHSISANSHYYHVLCVGKFGSDRWSVAGQEIKGVGPAFAPFTTFEFDTNGTAFRTFGTTTAAAAKATCNSQSGVYPAVFDHGYFTAF